MSLVRVESSNTNEAPLLIAPAVARRITSATCLRVISEFRLAAARRTPAHDRRPDGRLFLQTISPELQEAAAIDGANAWQRFQHITWPLLLPVTMVVTLFSVIQTFADFQLVYVLTGGGPANATHLFATYAYQIGIGTGLLSEGAAISLAIFPILFTVVLVQLLYIRRVETR